MPVVWDAAVSTAIGATATIAGVVAGGMISRRGEDRRWLRDTQMGAYAAVLREYTRIEFELRSAYHRNMQPSIDWAPWGAALASLSLVATHDVGSATSALSEAMRSFEQFVLGGKRSGDEDLQAVTRIVASAQMTFVDTARRSLERSQHPLPWQLGGPPAPVREFDAMAQQEAET